MSVGRIYVDLLARTGSFETDINRSAKLAAKRAKEIDEAFTKAGKVIGASLVAGAAVAAAAMKATINRMDDMSKAAQKSSMSTEAFSRLAYAGSLADVSMQELQASMGKLAQAQVAALEGTSQQAEVFRRLGIDVRDAEGKLRDTSDVFADFADRFQRFQGSPQIVADGMAIFGRSFQTMIPLLKDGSQGLKDAGEEAVALGAELSTRAGKEAEAFNDNLTRLKTATQGLAQTVTIEMLPAAVALTGELVSLAKEALGADGFVRKLAEDGTLKEWAQNSAIAVAVLAESLFAAGKTAMAVLGSFQAVWADIELAGTVVQKGMWGGLFFEENRKDLSKALEKRNKTVEESNDRLVDLWNYDSTRLSDALRRSFAEPASEAASGSPDPRPPEPPEPPKPPKPGKPGKPGKPSGPSALTDAEKAREAVDRMIRSLQIEIEKFGKNPTDQLLRDAWYAGPRPALVEDDQLKQLRELSESFEKVKEQAKAAAQAQTEIKSAFDATRTPAEKLAIELSRLDELLAAGMDWDTYARAVFAAHDAYDALAVKVEETLTKADEFALEAARNIQSYLGDSLFNVLDGNFDDIGKSFGNMLKRMAAEALAADLARSMFGDYAKTGKAGGWLGTAMTAVGSIFGGGGARAAGGPVESGKSYLVGERGPEYFTPAMSGHITPNGAGGVTIHQTNSFSSNVDRAQMAAYAQRIKAATIAEIRQANLAGEALTG